MSFDSLQLTVNNEPWPSQSEFWGGSFTPIFRHFHRSIALLQLLRQLLRGIVQDLQLAIGTHRRYFLREVHELLDVVL